MEIKIESLEKINEAAKEFIYNIGENRLFAFYGKMGAGKTTFIKAICEQLGVRDVITSPTFAIVNEYGIEDGEGCQEGIDGEVDTVYHFDFYRIKKEEEVYDMGCEEYFYSGQLCFMEWPELVEDILPEETIKVSITEEADGSRRVMV